ncbi:unnamed protein product [Prorocentrum cordatum]|uniref:J domain-containing protein n=1 Tax=Prorocentrum cordatum TaxID=2364126 RepID=A0ABN9TT94_9DINO|nr:unnamed protein product [Polarella glacialis]
MSRSALNARLLAASAHVKVGSARLDRGGDASTGASACVVEVADLDACIPGDPASGAWQAKAKVVLQKHFKRFGPLLEVKIPTSVASLRFASSKGPDAVMVTAPRGYLAVGDGEVRLRLPGAPEAVWRRFPPARPQAGAPEARGAGGTQAAGAESAAKRRKLRPNERFAARLQGAAEEEEDLPAAAPAPAAAPEPPAPEPPPQELPVAPPEPERPSPATAGAGASAEDLAVCRGEEEVAKGMVALLDLPFSRRKKALRALRLQWHPDKRPEEQEVATRVFQFIQAHDCWLAHHGIVDQVEPRPAD